MTWEQVDELDRASSVFILPIGAIEAHGPHLPLCTDDVIAEAMARTGGERISEQGYAVVVLPTLSHTCAGFASAFPGTFSNDPTRVSDEVVAFGRTLARHGFRWLALANAHLDPVHLGSLRRAVDELGTEAPEIRVSFPDVTRRPWAARLTEEFRSGACHAGRYEGSVVLAEKPDLVRNDLAAELAPVEASLLDAIRAGKTSFADAGGGRAYFGAPAEATVDEGRETVRELGGILYDAVMEMLRDADMVESPGEGT